MHCNKCGTALQEGDVFCPICGTRILSDSPSDGLSSELPLVSSLSGDHMHGSGENYVPSWKQTFAAVALRQAQLKQRLSGPAAAAAALTSPKKRRSFFGTALLMSLCVLLLSAALVLCLLLSSADSFPHRTLYGGTGQGFSWYFEEVMP